MTVAMLYSVPNLLPGKASDSGESVRYLADLTTQTGVSLQGVILAICGTILGALIGIRALAAWAEDKHGKNGHPHPGRGGRRRVPLLPRRNHGNAESPVHLRHLRDHPRAATGAGPGRSTDRGRVKQMALQLPTDTASLRLEN